MSVRVIVAALLALVVLAVAARASPLATATRANELASPLGNSFPHIPCALCEATIDNVAKIPESQCVTLIGSVCTTLKINCSPFVETLACGAIKTLLANANSTTICTKYVKCT
jgi:hypothetical protein